MERFDEYNGHYEGCCCGSCIDSRKYELERQIDSQDWPDTLCRDPENCNGSCQLDPACNE